MGIIEGSTRVSQDTRQQPGHGVDDYHGRQLPAGEHVVANRDFVGHQVLAHALVHPFIPPTDENDSRAAGQLSGDGMGKQATLRAQEYDGYVLTS